jgi:hypothetical protein
MATNGTAEIAFKWDKTVPIARQEGMGGNETRISRAVQSAGNPERVVKRERTAHRSSVGSVAFSVMGPTGEVVSTRVAGLQKTNPGEGRKALEGELGRQGVSGAPIFRRTGILVATGEVFIVNSEPDRGEREE